MSSQSYRPSRLSQGIGVGCLTLFALPFAGFGAFMGWKIGSEVYLSIDSQSWAEVQANLTKVELDDFGGDNGSKKVIAEYTYSFEGKQYSSDRVSIHSEADNISSYHRKKFEELRDKKKAGQPVVCYVDPDDPSSALLDRAVRPVILMFEGMFFLVFGGVGLGLLCGSYYAWRSTKKESKLADAAPREPWLWREDWKSGTITSSNKAGMIAISLFALFWNLISMPVSILFFLSEQKKGEWWVVPLISIFPLVGIAMIVWAIYKFLHWYRYGESTLRLASVPGVVGGQLAGVILAPSMVKPSKGFKVTLSCLKTYESGDSERVECLWQDQRRITKTLIDHEPGRIGVPIVFTIPSEAEPTNEEADIEWQVEVEAKVEGIDYQATFTIPVFRTEDSREGVSVDQSPLSDFEQVESLDNLLLAEGIIAQETGAIGGMRYYSPPARNKGSAIGTTLFMLVWNGMVTGMFIGGVGWMSWFFAFFGLILIWATLEAWLAFADLVIVGEQWRTRNGWYGLRSTTKEFKSSNITAIIGDKSLSTSSGKEVRQWNNLVAQFDDGPDVILMRHVRSRVAERMLLAELRRLAGMETATDDQESPWDDL